MIDKRGTNIPPHFIIKVAYIIVVFFTFHVGKYISLFANLLGVLVVVISKYHIPRYLLTFRNSVPENCFGNSVFEKCIL